MPEELDAFVNVSFVCRKLENSQYQLRRQLEGVKYATWCMPIAMVLWTMCHVVHL